jgi:hypothetical protein
MLIGGLVCALLFIISFSNFNLLFATSVVLYRMNLDDFPRITVSSINCNSLNMSSINSLNHKLKIYGITKLNLILFSYQTLGLAINKLCPVFRTYGLLSGQIRMQDTNCTTTLPRTKEALVFY